MKNKLTYITLILIHIGLGIAIFVLPFLSKIISILIVVLGLAIIVKNKNRNNEVLFVASYIVSIEVLMRMTDGMFFHEFGKYSVILVMFTGWIYSGFSKNAVLYWVFLMLLIPGIIKTATDMTIHAELRKAIAFNLSGPVCLGITAIYCYRRRITFEKLNKIIICMALPVVSLITYLFLYSPSVKDVITGTDSNFDTSGGFGPNQVSTTLGLGIFLFFTMLLLNSKSKRLILLHGFLTVVVAFRGIVTFSRGGVFTGIAMISVLMLVVFRNANPGTRVKIGYILIVTILFSSGIWMYTSYQTSGLINKRYANEDALGREKKDRLGGRELLAKTELQMFWDNPLLGIGVGKNKEVRKQATGIDLASHNEITRLLAEHGTFGVLAFLILFLTPLILSIDNRQHLYLYPFFIFWLLTINHAAMRMAVPAFIYALSLLKVESFEKTTLHRK